MAWRPKYRRQFAFALGVALMVVPWITGTANLHLNWETILVDAIATFSVTVIALWVYSIVEEMAAPAPGPSNLLVDPSVDLNKFRIHEFDDIPMMDKPD